jgi:citrate lyase subunit beta / citryl-CoA lyase
MSNKNILLSARSFLFVPANRPERFVKAISSGADAIILDLEDSVPLHQKALAREAIKVHWSELQTKAVSVVIRINSPLTDEGVDDLSALRSLSDLVGVMVPKCESAESLAKVTKVLPHAQLLPIIESTAGFLELKEISLASQVARLVVGHIDFLADTGMVCSEDQQELDTLRFQVAMCSRFANLSPAIDGVTVSVDDEKLIRADTERSIRFGFSGKLCIHPKQVDVVHNTFKPSASQIDWAKRVLDANEKSNGAAVQLDGKMVDLPVVLQAQRLLARLR